MNNSSNCSSCCGASARSVACAIGVVGTMLLMAGLVWAMQHYTKPAPVGQGRVQERVKNLKEVQAAGHTALDATVESDKDRGVWHVPVSRGMDLVEREWRDPQAGRKLLLERVKVATTPLPEKKSQFE